MISHHQDTITGIATAFGEAGVSIIRISGDLALPLAEKSSRQRAESFFNRSKTEF